MANPRSAPIRVALNRVRRCPSEVHLTEEEATPSAVNTPNDREMWIGGCLDGAAVSPNNIAERHTTRELAGTSVKNPHGRPDCDPGNPSSRTNKLKSGEM